MKSNGWKTVKLKHLSIDGKGHYGIGASAVEYSPDLFTYLRITDINDDGTLNYKDLKSVDASDADKYILQDNDIVFARTGNSTGRSYFYDKRDGELVFAGFLIKFSIDPIKVNPKYIKYYAQSKHYRNWIDSVATGSTRKNINANMYGDMELTIPNRYTQDKIVLLLSAIDDKIRYNNQINEKLEETAKAIYNEWFVNFNFPDENGLPYKDNGGEFYETELGEIPVGWEVVELKSIFNFQKGKKPIGIVEYEDENYLPYITLDAIRNNNVQYAKNEKVITINELDNIMVMDGASSGEIYFGFNGVLGSTFSVLNIYNESIITSSILYYMIKSIEQQIKDNTTGSAIPHTDKELVYKTLIAIPKNVDIINDIDKILLKFRLQMINNSNQNIKLDNLKNLLLNKLMSGQIDVEELDIDWDKLSDTLEEVEAI